MYFDQYFEVEIKLDQFYLLFANHGHGKVNSPKLQTRRCQQHCLHCYKFPSHRSLIIYVAISNIRYRKELSLDENSEDEVILWCFSIGYLRSMYNNHSKKPRIVFNLCEIQLNNVWKVHHSRSENIQKPDLNFRREGKILLLIIAYIHGVQPSIFDLALITVENFISFKIHCHQT